jgi:hypothetical protein|tara:strand:- start:8965 stop:9117 length:153 start_codon:yes stop_codon:yes gene_type:complete
MLFEVEEFMTLDKLLANPQARLSDLGAGVASETRQVRERFDTCRWYLIYA